MSGDTLITIILFLASQIVAFVSVCVWFYARVQTKLKELEIRIQVVERQDAAILSKLDDIGKEMKELNISLHNKKDRER